jgi:hypothetical protein
MSQVGQKLEHHISAGQADRDSRHRVLLASFNGQEFHALGNRQRNDRDAFSDPPQQTNRRAAILTGLPSHPARTAQSLGD